MAQPALPWVSASIRNPTLNGLRPLIRTAVRPPQQCRARQEADSLSDFGEWQYAKKIGFIVVSFTGMLALKHDGSRHHGVGIAPTVPIAPTAVGIAAGKDEVLEKAVQVLQFKLDRNDSGP